MVRHHDGGSFQALPGYILGTSALTAGGAGAPNFTSYSGDGVHVDRDVGDELCRLPRQLGVAGLRRRRAGHPGDGCDNPLNSGTFTVPLDAPGTLLTPRVNQLDLSFSKRITVGGHQVRPEDRHLQRVELGRLLHAFAATVFSPTTNAALTTPVTRGSAGTYLQPGSILQGRIIRLGAVVTW